MREVDNYPSVILAKRNTNHRYSCIFMSILCVLLVLSLFFTACAYAEMTDNSISFKASNNVVEISRDVEARNLSWMIVIGGILSTILLLFLLLFKGKYIYFKDSDKSLADERDYS